MRVVPRLGASLLACVLLLGFSTGCRKPKLNITSPAHGTFTLATSVVITGNVQNIGVANANVEVNGTPVTILPDKTWFSDPQILDASAVFNPFLVELKRNDGSLITRKRIVVIAGDSVADGEFSLDSVALRINDSGLDTVEGVVEGLVDFDLASLLSPGTVLIDDFCAIDGGFLGCLGGADVEVSNPPPSVSSFDIDVDSFTNLVAADVTVTDLRVDLDVEGSGLVPSCSIRIKADEATVFGDYALSADWANDPSNVDVNLLGQVISLSGFDLDFTDGLCDFSLIGDLILLIVGDVSDIVLDGLDSFLEDPDGTGLEDAPIAEAIEEALAEISIAGPIGDALGVNLEAPLYGVFEDVDGITLGADVRITVEEGTDPGQCIRPPGAPDLPASYHVDQFFPTFGPLTPGGSPYQMGLCLSASAFNQLMKAEIECGLLQTELTELDFGTGAIPISAALLGQFIPEFAPLGSTPLKIVIQPTLAPVITGNPGPGGELTEMRIGQLLIEIQSASGAPVTYLGGAADAVAGLDFVFDAGELLAVLGAPLASDISVSILDNTINTNAAAVEQLLPLLLAPLLPTLADSLGSIPLPEFLDLQLEAVEVALEGQFLSIFADLVPAP